MDNKLLVALSILLLAFSIIVAQHENIPYENVENICEKCNCKTRQDSNKTYFHYLNCSSRSFQHILARWPDEFGRNHDGVKIAAFFSFNNIPLLQQLPATNASLSFVCRHCNITDLQAPTFMDVPNIVNLDLSYNLLTTDELTPDVFRGPYRSNRYEPTALESLDLSHNKLRSLNKRIFEHTPNLKKLFLAYNPINVIDTSLIAALASANTLELLDLSHTGIDTLPTTILKGLSNLHSLLLTGNRFIEIPAGLVFVSKSLRALNIAENPIQLLDDKSFRGLSNLKHLNISELHDTRDEKNRHSASERKHYTLRMMDNDTMVPLRNLESLQCKNNFNLDKFDLNGLLFAKNLTEVDLSNCGLTTVTFGIDFTLMNISVAPKPWPKLRYFDIVGNPLLCDCDLFQTMEYIGIDQLHKDSAARCENPYIFAGALISNYSSEFVCSLKLPRKYQAIDEEPPRFLRRRYVILTIIIASIVIVVGLIAGFIVACIRRRLKRSEYGVEPIRYMSVRSSNLTAFTNSMQRNSTRQSDIKA